MDDLNTTFGTDSGPERAVTPGRTSLPSARAASDRAWVRLVGVGDVHFGADNIASALEYYERALVLMRKDDVDEGDVIAIELKMAKCLTRRSHHQAKRLLDDLEERGSRLEDPILAARIKAQMGRTANCLNDYEAAKRYCEDAYEVLRNTDENQEIGELEIALGTIANRFGEMDRAAECYESALFTFRRIDNSKGIARALSNLGTLLMYGSRYREARDYLTRALAVAEESGNYSQIGSLCLNIGIFCYKTGEWELSSKHLTRTLVIAKETGPTSRVIRAHIALGILKLRLRQFSLAESHFIQILELARKHGYKREEGLALEFLGDKALRQGDLDKAEEYLDRALAVSEEISPDSDVVGEVLSRQAEVRMERQQYDSALTAAERALEVAQKRGDAIEEGRSLRIMGEIRAHSGEFVEAEAHFTRAVQVLSEGPDALELCLAQAAEARFLALRGVKAEQASLGRQFRQLAVARIEELVSRYLDLRLPEHAVHCLMDLARVHDGFGELDEALGAVARAIEMSESESVSQVHHKLETLRTELEERCADESLTHSAEYQLLREVSDFGPTDTDTMVRTYLKLACERSKSDRAVLAVRNRGTDLRVECFVGYQGEETPKRPVLAGIFDEFEAGRKIHVVNNPKLDSRYCAFNGFADALSGIVAIPVQLPGDAMGMLYLDRLASSQTGLFRNPDLRLLSFFAGLISVFLSAREGERRSQQSNGSGEEARDDAYSKFISCNDEMRRSITLLRKLDKSDAGVLVTGETGTGKGLLARLIHDSSSRSRGSFVPINCAALPEALLESELFGHVQGAFTGAVRKKHGLFEEAEGGTLFLDEVDKAPLGVQGKLLHVLDKHEIRPVGSTRWKPVDVRVICASNVNLRRAIEEGRFLEDLYYRLNDFQVHIPPLRKRREDIPLLVRYFYGHFTEELGRTNVRLTRELLQALTDHDWRGNVRELEKVVKRMIVLAEDGEALGLDSVPREILTGPNGTPIARGTLKSEVQKLEAQMIHDSLRAASGNKSEVARQLRISYPCLLSKIKQYGLEPGRASRARG